MRISAMELRVMSRLVIGLRLVAIARGAFAGPRPGAGGQAPRDLDWSVVTGLELRGEGGALSGLAAISDTDLWACGSFREGGGRHTLVQHWDGARWTLVPSPDGPKATSWVTGIAAVDTNDVWIIGYSTERDV